MCFRAVSAINLRVLDAVGFKFLELIFQIFYMELIFETYGCDASTAIEKFNIDA